MKIFTHHPITLPGKISSFSLAIWFSLCGLSVERTLAEDMKYHYDDAGRLIGVQYEGGRSISYVYDAAGNILKRLVTTIEDTDGDFMDDDFERTHFTNLDRDGTLDFDGDGFSDLEEFLAGTLPKDDTSLLTISDIVPGGEGASISWTSTNGKIYRVQYTEDPASPVWKDLPGDVIATTVSASKKDPAETVSKRFYRVVVLQ